MTSKKEEKNEKAAAERDELASVFRVFDKDNSGSITKDELISFFKNLNITIDEKALDKTIAEVDDNGNGEIDFNEFVVLMHSTPKSDKKIDELREAFKVFDLNNDGKISADELQLVLSKYGENVTKEDIELIMSTVDLDGNGTIDYDEFRKMMLDGPVVEKVPEKSEKSEKSDKKEK